MFNDKNKLRSSSKIDNNSFNITDFYQNSLFPNGIYNEELYSSFANSELMGQINNNFKDFLSNNMIAIVI